MKNCNDKKLNNLHRLRDYIVKREEAIKISEQNQIREQNQNLEQFCCFLERKGFGWYPSSFCDFRPILVSRRKVMEHHGVQVPAAFIEPNSWILSDDASIYHPLDDKAFDHSWHHWVNGYVFHDDLTEKWGTKITFESCRRLPMRIFGNYSDRHYLIELKIHCAIAGEYQVEVFFMNSPNEDVLKLMEINKGIPTVLAAAGAGCGELVNKLLDGRSAQLGVKYAIVNKIQGYANCGGDLRIGDNSCETCNLWVKPDFTL